MAADSKLDIKDLEYKKFEDETHVIKTIEYEHHEIHHGYSFTTHFDNITTNDDNHRTAIGFKTPNTTKWAHIVSQISSSSPSEFYMIEAPTIDDGVGTSGCICIRDRNSDNNSTIIELSGTPTINKASNYIEAQLATLSGGTRLGHVQLIGGIGPKAAGGDSRGSQEWILKQNTKYLFVLQNIGANENTHEIELDWYEHQNKIN